MLHSGTMPLIQSILDQIDLTSIVDIGITALLIYWLFKLIRGTRAVRLVIGVSVLVICLRPRGRVRPAAPDPDPAGRRGRRRVRPRRRLPARAATRARADRARRVVRLAPVAGRFARRRPRLDRGRARGGRAVGDGQGALIVLERETGLEEVAETGVMIHGDVSADLLGTIFTPKSPLHDGAVIIRDDRVVAAGALLPLAETSIHTERFGTRHRAALGITEQTDAVVVVVSEENGQISLVERARIVRNLNEAGLARAIQSLLDPADGRRGRLRLAIGGAGSHHPGSFAATPRARPLVGRSPGDSPGETPPPVGGRGAAVGAGPCAHGGAGHPGRAAPAAAPPIDAAGGHRRQPRRPPPDDDVVVAGGRQGAAVRRILRRIVHNWPLKVAAVGLATLMYGGLALSQNTQTYPGEVPVRVVNQPPKTVAPGQSEAGDVDPLLRAERRAGRSSSSFVATVDLAGVVPKDGQATVSIDVEPVDPRIRVLGYDPAVASIVLEPAHVEERAGPGRARRRPRRADPRRRPWSTRRTSRSRVRNRSSPRSSRPAPTSSSSRPASTSTRTSSWSPVDQLGNALRPLEVTPPTARVDDPGLLRSPDPDAPGQSDHHRHAGRGLRDRVGDGRPAGRRSSPVTPTSSPALTRVDTAPIPMTGVSADETVSVALALPAGVVAVGYGADQRHDHDPAGDRDADVQRRAAPAGREQRPDLHAVDRPGARDDRRLDRRPRPPVRARRWWWTST